MVSSDLIALALFLTLAGGIAYAHSNSPIEISTCTDAQGNVTFLGPKEDLEKIRTQVPELKFSVCSEKDYTKDDWRVLKYRMNNRVIILQNAKVVQAQ